MRKMYNVLEIEIQSSFKNVVTRRNVFKHSFVTFHLKKEIVSKLFYLIFRKS